jgi:transposase, IS5 family
MRQERAVQASIFDLFAELEIGRELKAMSWWLDEHREPIGWRPRICADKALGRPGVIRRGVSTPIGAIEH